MNKSNLEIEACLEIMSEGFSRGFTDPKYIQAEDTFLDLIEGLCSPRQKQEYLRRYESLGATSEEVKRLHNIKGGTRRRESHLWKSMATNAKHIQNYLEILAEQERQNRPRPLVEL